MVDKKTDDDESLTNEEIATLQKLFPNMGVDDGMGFPEAPTKHDMVSFFREILNLKKEFFDQISRTGNLNQEELGRMPLHTRAYLNIANYSETEGLDNVAKYLRSKSNVIINTSLSRKAKFLELFVTQKKVSKNLGTPKKETKKGMFGETIKEEGGEET